MSDTMETNQTSMLLDSALERVEVAQGMLDRAKDREEKLEQRILALEAALRHVRHEVKMLSILDEWCGANLTEKEQANAAMRQSKSIVEYIDALLHDKEKTE